MIHLDVFGNYVGTPSDWQSFHVWLKRNNIKAEFASAFIEQYLTELRLFH